MGQRANQPTHEGNPHGDVHQRYRSESALLVNAIAGDESAIRSVLKYMGSGNPDLRRMMQAALHDHPDSDVWGILLGCLAYSCWGEVAIEPELGEELADSQASLPPIPLQDAHTQTIAEAFVIDESEAEREIKDQLLSRELDNPDEKVRYAATYLKGLRGDAAMVPRLEQLIDCGQLQWQLRAIQALVVIHDERCGAPLVNALALYRQTKGGRELHLEARRALSDLGRKAETAYLEALNHPDSHIRWHAARGLGMIGDPRGLDILASGLYDENQAVRWATASVLANLDATAVPAILKVLTQRAINEPLRQAAYHALHAMPSSQTRAYLEPLLEALHSPAAPVQAPSVAQRFLREWKNAD